MGWMNKKTYINISQILVDAVCLIVSYIITVLLTGRLFRSVSMGEYLWVPVLFAMVYIFTMFTCEMYHRSTFTYQDRTLRYVLKACMLAATFCMVMMPFASKSNIGIDFLMIYFLTVLVLICIQCLIIQELRLSNNSRWKKRAILVGYRENIQEYLYYIKKTSFQVDVAGYVTLDKNTDSDSFQLSSLIKGNIVDEVIFAIPNGKFEEVKAMVSHCQERGLTVRIAMDIFEGYNSKKTVHSVGTIPVFTWQTAGLNDFQSFVKRLMDIVGAMIGLCIFITASVLIIPIIRIQIGGPVFIRRPYISLNGRPFTLYWFRTSSEQRSQETLIGKLLRRTGMDHLPMFWNVLRGDMSLVGSIPVPAVNLDLLTNKEFRNFCIRPGLTGTWRFTEDNRNNDEEYLTEINIRYVQSWSFTHDIWLIIKTLAVMITKKSGLCLFERLKSGQNAEIGYNL